MMISNRPTTGFQISLFSAIAVVVEMHKGFPAPKFLPSFK